MTMQYRQGDVLLVQVKALPAKAWSDVPDSRVILALGERTGHAHAIDSGFARSFSSDDGRYVQVSEGATLVHDEHSAIRLREGIYKVILQKQFIDRKRATQSYFDERDYDERDYMD